MQRAIRYSLTGKIIEHVLIVLYGFGSNGKTTLIDALHYLLGPSYAKYAPTDLLLARRGEHHPTELATLHGARLVTAAETGEGRRLAESLVKQLTGGDPVTALAHGRRLLAIPAGVQVVARDKPQTADPRHRSRYLAPHSADSRSTLPFTRPRPGRHHSRTRRYSRACARSAAGILAWAVHGCLAWPVVRNLTQARDGGHDLLGLPGWSAEVKRAARPRIA